MNEGPKSIRIALLIVIFLIGCTYLARGTNHASEDADDSKLIPWRVDYSAATDEAKKTGKPLFLWFTATWCGPCQSLKSMTWNDPKVAAELANYVCVKLDVDKPSTKPLADKYQVDGIPRFVALDKSGSVVHDGVGAMPATEFLDFLHNGQQTLRRTELSRTDIDAAWLTP